MLNRTLQQRKRGKTPEKSGGKTPEKATRGKTPEGLKRLQVKPSIFKNGLLGGFQGKSPIGSYTAEVNKKPKKA